ncbi:myosin-9 isoform X2 [Drosophila hydei]|uniref:Myosin-9 isoform X2 n=1 Tax=Drosophila hydei TaxID=7224 RepID=A0A6J1LCE9_DROHY|nr:myosin-9 isoform X2 [Drosophila hydei]
MDIVDICPEDESKFSYSNSSWSRDDGQVKLSAKKQMMEQQQESWDTSQDMIRLARMRIVTSVMLHAWRQRRADVRKLQQVVERLQKSSIYSKNELHVSNTLMRIEEKRCRELQLELKKSTLSMKQVQTSFELLNVALINLRAEKQNLEKELLSCRQGHLELKEIAAQCNDDLRKALCEQRCLKQQLVEEQSNVRQLKHDKERLMNEICDMEREHLKRKESFSHELEKKNEELSNMRATVEKLENKLKQRQISI